MTAALVIAAILGVILVATILGALHAFFARRAEAGLDPPLGVVAGAVVLICLAIALPVGPEDLGEDNYAVLLGVAGVLGAVMLIANTVRKGDPFSGLGATLLQLGSAVWRIALVAIALGFAIAVIDMLRSIFGHDDHNRR